MTAVRTVRRIPTTLTPQQYQLIALVSLALLATIVVVRALQGQVSKFLEAARRLSRLRPPGQRESAAIERLRAWDGRLDPDTYAGPGSWDAARQTAGAGLSAIEALANGEGDVAFVGARPPGHHALADRAMGFCTCTWNPASRMLRTGICSCLSSAAINAALFFISARVTTRVAGSR